MNKGITTKIDMGYKDVIENRINKIRNRDNVDWLTIDHIYALKDSLIVVCYTYKVKVKLPATLDPGE